MNRLSLWIGGFLASQAILLSALAQEPGVGTGTPAPYKKVSPADKAAGKAQRKEEGRAAVKEGVKTGEITPQPPPQAKVPREQGRQARAERKAETARAARAGELQTTGEVGPVK